MLSLGGLIFIARAICEAYRMHSVEPMPEFLVFCTSAGLVILSLVQLETSGQIKVPKVLVLAGSASYSVYLVHFSVIRLLASVVGKYPSAPINDIVFLMIAACGILVGLLFHRCVDHPVQRFLRRRKHWLIPDTPHSYLVGFAAVPALPELTKPLPRNNEMGPP